MIARALTVSSGWTVLVVAAGRPKRWWLLEYERFDSSEHEEK